MDRQVIFMEVNNKVVALVWYGSITILKEVTFDGILKPTTKIYETG
jgi:hypothetical protein